MRLVGFRIQDEEATSPLAKPLDQAPVIGAPQQGVNAIERVGAAAAGRHIRRFGPLINHRKREAKIGGDLLGTALLKDLTQNFMRLHARNIEKLTCNWQGLLMIKWTIAAPGNADFQSAVSPICNRQMQDSANNQGGFHRL